MKKIIKLKNLSANNKAVAGVLVAVLLIGLFISIIAFIQTVYVPQWMENKEIEHNDEVLDQFTNIKSSVDLLTVTGQKQKPISTNIKMGTKELPFLFSQRSYGSLQLLPNDCAINVSYINGGSDDSQLFNLGSLIYTSYNFYHIQKSCIFENGGVILSQPSGEVMIIEPDMYASNDKITMNLVGLCGFDKFTSISGYGTYPVKTEFSFDDFWYSRNVTKISFITSHAKAWKLLVNDTLLDKLVYKTDFEIDDTDEGFDLLFLDPDGFSVDLSINYIKIKITQGWTN
jgi:hypothetical protein